MEATSIDDLVTHCQRGRLTGILRMRAHEGIGEVWFLSGVADEVHFGTSTKDEAMARMRRATEATYELVARLPHPGGGFKKRFPSKGSIATATPVTLMRYCEQYALTCTLEVESGNVLVEAKYELGELVSVETTADDDGITRMLEAQEGTYEFKLPRVELPAGTPVLPPATGLAESIPPPESIAFRALPASDEEAVKRKTVEIARQQKASPKPAEAKKVEVKPAVATTPKPAIARAAPRPTQTKKAAAKKEEPKIVPAPIVEVKAAPAPVEPVKSPPPPKADAEKEEAKPAAAAVVREKREEPKKEETEPAVVAEERDEPAATPEVEEPAAPEKAAGVPAKQSWSWVVVPLLLVAAVAYLWWTHRF